MKFTILSRLQAMNHQVEQPYVHISVYTPGYKPVKLPINRNRIGKMYLAFSDVDKVKSWPLDDGETEIIYFDEKMAKRILNFVTRYKEKINLVVINCEAGISRSAGVGAALSKIINKEDELFFKQFRPNMLVYRTILEQYYEV